MDGGAWLATVHGVAKSRTPLSDFTFTFIYLFFILFFFHLFLLVGGYLLYNILVVFVIH